MGDNVAYAVIGFQRCNHGRHLEFVALTGEFGIIEDLMKGYDKKARAEGKPVPDHYRVFKCALDTGEFLEDEVSKTVYRFRSPNDH